MLLNVVDHFAPTWMSNPKTNARSRKSVSLQQLLECRFDHGASQVLNRRPEHDPQFSIAMMKSNLLDLLRIDESFKIDDLWIAAIGLLAGCKHEGCSAISANRVADNCFEGVIDVV